MAISFGLKPIVKMYEKHSIACTGMKGSGKDMLTTNVIIRRGLPYVSNVSCGGDFIPLDFKDIMLGNSWRNLTYGNIVPYTCPYPEKADVYISDAGIYLPSQYCNELNKAFPDLSTFMIVQRHLNDGKTHYNCQNLNRVYDKIRELCDVYIYSEWCKVFCGFVVQSVIVYDKAESCQARIKPCRVSTRGIFPSSEERLSVDLYLDNFYNTHGSVKRYFLIYRNKSNYDTRYFKSLFGEVYSNEK